MIPRSYSRDPALQLNFMSDAALENDLEATTGANYDGRIARLVLFGFADSRIDTQMSFNVGDFRNLKIYVVLFTLAAFSAVFFILPRPRFLSRYQSDEVPG